MASTDARPVPIKNTAFRATFPILDNTGEFVSGAAGLDSEVSKDAGTFADCTNEATEIATSSGVYYLDLTSAEMNADTVTVKVKTSTTNAKSTLLVFYPQESGDIKVDVQSVAGTAQTARDIGASVLLSSGTGTGQVSLSSGAVLLQATQTGVTIPTVTNLTNAPTSGDLTATMKTSVTTAATAATPAAASVTGNVGGSVASIASGGITAASFAADSITAAKLASDVTTELQTGLATASALSTAQSGITSIKAKTDNLPASPAAVSDIPTAAANADAVWDEVLSGHLTSGTTGAGLNAAGSAGDPWATTLPGSYGAGTAGKIVGDNLDAPVSGVSGSGLDAAATRAALGLASANLDTQLANISGDVDGLGTLLAAADADIEDIKAVTDLLPNAGALTSLATAAAVSTLTGYVDTEVGAIKAQTDKLTFNADNEVAVSLESINGSALKGDGSSIPWGKA